jgi:Ca-activated chloride channel family protein
MVPGTRRLVVAELALRAPGSSRLMIGIAKVHVAWRRPGNADVSTFTDDVSVEIADREPTFVREAAMRVMLVRADRVREEARALADRGNFAGAATLLRALLGEIDRVPGFVLADGSPLAEAYELLVDEAMAMERKPDQEAYAMYRKSAMGSKLAVHAPPAASSRGVASSKLLEHTAGNFPEAYVIVKNGAGAGQRHRLREECVIGRTASADVPIASDGVSRRHAEIYALEGEFWACDLGSTNVTKVNGEPLGSAPRKLKVGDVLLVGDVELVYEEKLPPSTKA